MSDINIDSRKGCWTQVGFDEFIKGQFGNGGHNIYVSRGGVLQRIHRFDATGDGYVDLFFVNSQDMNERPPVYVVSDPLGEAKITELTTLGAYAGAVGDLNGDGYDDLVLANQCNGTHSDVTAFVYYGSEEGLTERYKIELPVPDGRGVAIGDFNGDGLQDLAFITGSSLRIFYQTPSHGFIPREHKDFDLDITHICAGDLNGDGCAELYVRVRDQKPRILWGGVDGIDPENFTEVGEIDKASDGAPGSTPGWITYNEGWRTKILNINGKPHVFRPEGAQAFFYPVNADRTLGEPIVLDCDGAVSAAAGDINGDGFDEIAVAICTVWRDVPQSKIVSTDVYTESSWIYWGSADGFDENRRTAIDTRNARDMQIGALRDRRFSDLVVCQGRDHIMNTTESLVFKGMESGIDPEPTRFLSHDAGGALIARTSSDSKPQLLLINHVTGGMRGDVNAYIYLGGPDGYSPERRIEIPSWAAPDGAFADLNDDGLADVLISNCSENAPWLDPGTVIYWNSPDGFDKDRSTALPTFRAHGSAIGDFRHSGYLDIAIGGFSNPELLIFRGGPDGYDTENPQRIILDPKVKDAMNTRGKDWSVAGDDSNYSEVRWLYAADLNNNGWLDLFVSQVYGPKSLILWGGPEGFSMERCTWLAAEGAICAQVADLTGNGYLDLILGGHMAASKNWRYDSYVYVYWNGPEGIREDRRSQLACHCANSLTIADFNNDGILDIFATSYNSGHDRDLDSYIFWGKPGGKYSVEDRTRLFCHSASGCIAADFNEDGYVDIAVAHHKTYGSHTGLSKVWWNGPEGFCEHHTTKLPTAGPHGMVAVDPGNAMDRGPEEFYVSVSHELPDGVKVTGISWEADIQIKTWVKAQVRCGESIQELQDAAWQGSDGVDTWFSEPTESAGIVLTGKFVQYRLALGAINGCNTPRVKSVTVHYELV